MDLVQRFVRLEYYPFTKALMSHPLDVDSCDSAFAGQLNHEITIERQWKQFKSEGKSPSTENGTLVYNRDALPSQRSTLLRELIHHAAPVGVRIP